MLTFTGLNINHIIRLVKGPLCLRKCAADLLPAKPQIVTAQRPFALMIVGFSIELSEGAVLSIIIAAPNTALICLKLPLQLRLS